jgi:5,6-dimethylbenzimidazole synthase
VGDHAFSRQERQAVYRVISERRDMRRFVPDSTVPEEVLARVLQAAHAAPNVGLMQPWRFIRITDESLRRRIHALVDEERLLTATSSAVAPCRRWISRRCHARSKTFGWQHDPKAWVWGGYRCSIRRN